MAELASIDHQFNAPSSSVHRIQEAQTTIYNVPWELTLAAWGCKYSIVTLQRARIRGSARRAGPGDGCAELPQAVEDPQRSSTAVGGRGLRCGRAWL